jgi:hypothetical protein
MAPVCRDQAYLQPSMVFAPLDGWEVPILIGNTVNDPRNRANTTFAPCREIKKTADFS